MGLLDQLREESSSAKSSEQKEKLRLEELQKSYDSIVTPKLEQIWSFLKELEQHLNYLKPEVYVDYEVAGFGTFKNLNQAHYKMEKGRKNILKRIPFRYICDSNDTLHLSIEGNRKLAAVIEELDRIGLKYQCKKQRDANNEVFAGEIEVQASVPVSITFEGVVETASIQLTVKNYDSLTTSKTFLNPEHIDAEFLDQLGLFILRKENSFLKKELSEEEKQQFRKMVKDAEQERVHELKKADGGEPND